MEQTALTLPPAARPARRAAGSDEPPRTNVLGTGVSALSLKGAVALILRAVAARRRGYVCVCGVHGLIECRRDPALRRIHADAMAVVPDGMPLVWALHADGHAEAGRVYGPDLMSAVVAEGVAGGLRHFLYGATPETLACLEHALKVRHRDVAIVGCHAPPFRPLTEEEEREVAARIDAARPDIVWVGLSTPKQERWMASMRDRLEAPVLIGVGAAFDFIGGGKPRAPAVMQRAGLEWAFRLATEPRRLWRRYARIVPTYLALRALQRTGLVRFPLNGAEDAQ